MYRLSQEQIDFISADIKQRGIAMEELHESLLDHVCCILEEQMDTPDNFEETYKKVISTFYKDHLWEIEEETIMLLTYKHYYLMKKVMIISGTLSASILALGIFFKFMFWPGAALLIVSGLLGCSFIFLPLVFTTQVKEKESKREKVVFGLGTIQLFLISLHVLFKLMHWPFGMALFYASIIFLLGVYIPVYFVTGIRKETLRTRTIVYTVQLTLCGCLFLALYRTPKVATMQAVTHTTLFANGEQLLNMEREQVNSDAKPELKSTSRYKLSEKIYDNCSQLKSFILKCETGRETLPGNFEEHNLLIGDNAVGPYFDMDAAAVNKLSELIENVRAYNIHAGMSNDKLPLIPADSIKNFVRFEKSAVALNMLTQLQLLVLKGERDLLAQK